MPCTGAQQLLCDTPASLVAGYAEANRVSAALDAFYPTGAAECCTPSVSAPVICWDDLSAFHRASAMKGRLAQRSSTNATTVHSGEQWLMAAEVCHPGAAVQWRRLGAGALRLRPRRQHQLQRAHHKPPAGWL